MGYRRFFLLIFFFLAHGSITLDNILTNARVLETCISVYMHLIFIQPYAICVCMLTHIGRSIITVYIVYTYYVPI